jgi:cell envelope opacity-associated protein A
MRYLGLILIPLLAVLVFAGPGCQQAQDEPEVQIEQAVEETVEVPVIEKAPAAVEEADVEVEVDVDPEKEGSGLVKQLQEKGEEEIQKQADEQEVDKKLDDLGM